jgi:hypothetical protein
MGPGLHGWGPLGAEGVNALRPWVRENCWRLTKFVAPSVVCGAFPGGLDWPGSVWAQCPLAVALLGSVAESAMEATVQNQAISAILRSEPATGGIQRVSEPLGRGASLATRRGGRLGDETLGTRGFEPCRLGGPAEAYRHVGGRCLGLP